MNGKYVVLEILSRNLGKDVAETVKSQMELLSNHIAKSVKNKEERRSRYLLPLKYLFCYAQNSGLQDILKMELEQEKDFVTFLKNQTRKEEIRVKKLKVMTIVGTRPELIRLSEVIKKADKFFDHVFVHTGQNYDDRLNDIFYADLEIRKPVFYLDVAGPHLGETLGSIISRSYGLMQQEKPDALLKKNVLGGTSTNQAKSRHSAIRLSTVRIEFFS